MKIKFLRKAKTVFNLVKGQVKNYKKDINYRRTIKYTNYLLKSKVDDHIILYESFHGKGMVDNPYAIFKKLINDPKYKDFIHIWALNSLDPRADLYKNKSNVKFVKVHSDEYLKYLTKAKYLINNTTFPPYFQKKNGQVYINTWHGTPLKTLGKDMKGTIGQHKNIQRNFLHADYILNPNKFTADILVNSHDLDGIYNGYIVNEGYPRIDLTLNTNKNEFRNILERLLGIKLNKKIVLYAPTWRGEVNSVNNIREELEKIISEMHNKMPNDYILLLKVHTLTYKFIKNDETLKRICIPDWIDTNELLSIVDILVTDYSSIFFDYMVTNRPILFYVYDREAYETQRGLYLNLEDMPGPLCFTVEEVIQNIENINVVNERYKEKYKENYRKFCYNDDGKATERVLEIIFNQNKTKNVYQVVDKNKKNILMYCGGFLNNGITTSAINLMNHIDYSKYNVLLIDKGNHDSISESNFLKVNSKVKKFYRVGSINVNFIESFLHNLVIKKGLKDKRIHSYIPKNVYKREIKRLFGDTKIDIAVDFSGYVPFWSLLFAFGDFKKKNIYQHNDMAAEYNKKIKGKYKHRAKLNVIFPLYKYFDKVISVAEYTRELNLKNLHDFISIDQSSCVHNTLDYENILSQVENGTVYKASNNEYLLLENDCTNGVLSMKGIILPEKGNVNFVTMGRLSPEKDQKKLIKAFSKVEKLHPNIRLYIIGEGVLEWELKNLVKSLGLENKIYFTGQMTNPYFLINKCDCFILSSNHEGQPMVLLESLVLGKPIIATDIPGSRSILQDVYGKLVENSEAGLVLGMENYILNGYKGKEFHYREYNDKALDMFYTEVCQ